MADRYDPVPDLAGLFTAALRKGHDAGGYADRIAERLGLGEDDSRETVAAEFRKAFTPGLLAPEPSDETWTLTDSDYRLVVITRRGADVLVTVPAPALRFDGEKRDLFMKAFADAEMAAERALPTAAGEVPDAR